MKQITKRLMKHLRLIRYLRMLRKQEESLRVQNIGVY